MKEQTQVSPITPENSDKAVASKPSRRRLPNIVSRTAVSALTMLAAIGGGEAIVNASAQSPISCDANGNQLAQIVTLQDPTRTGFQFAAESAASAAVQRGYLSSKDAYVETIADIAKANRLLVEDLPDGKHVEYPLDKHGLPPFVQIGEVSNDGFQINTVQQLVNSGEVPAGDIWMSVYGSGLNPQDLVERNEHVLVAIVDHKTGQIVEWKRGILKGVESCPSQGDNKGEKVSKYTVGIMGSDGELNPLSVLAPQVFIPAIGSTVQE